MSNSIIQKYQEIKNKLDKNKIIKPTNLIYSDYFSEKYGATVYLKPENLQNSGSYKIRGSFNKMDKLMEEIEIKHVVTASAGNHAQGLASAAKNFNIKATIFMPVVTPALKIDATKRLGADVVVIGETFDDSLKAAYQFTKENNATFIHPFDDIDVAQGQGTVGLEILSELEDAQVLVVPIGGGGLIAGVAEYAKNFNPKIKVIGVEPSGAACMKQAVAQGQVVTLDKIATIAEGVAVKTAGSNVFGLVNQYVDEIITIDDSEIVETFLEMVEKHKLVAEGAGLISIAALKHLNIESQKVVSIISGGNLDILTMSKLLKRGLISHDRNVKFRIELKDVPGELLKVSQILNNVRVNVIQLDYDPYVSVNEFNLVHLLVRVECSGTKHKQEMIDEFKKHNYIIQIIDELKGEH
jgi:threonine dehydratase